MNFEMPEVGTLPGNSVWTETYIAYLSAVWRQIYIKRPYKWELVPVLHTNNCLAAEVAPDLEKTSSLIVGCARFTLELFYRPDVVPDLLRTYSQEVTPDLEKISSLLLSCARFTLKFSYQTSVVPDLHLNFFNNQMLCQVCSELTYPQEVAPDLEKNFIIESKLCQIYTKTFLSNKRCARFTL